MKEITSSQALHALKNAFGDRLETSRERGLRLMRETLEEAFGLTRNDADNLLEALERGKGVKWVEQTAGAAGPPSTPPFAQSPLSSAPQNAPVEVPIEGGYWRIGGAG